MNVLYHITNLPPKMAGTEASLQELDTLRRHFGGQLIHLNPNQISPIYLPRLLFGFHTLKAIKSQEKAIDLHHLYNADPFPFPFVRWLNRPVLYSISSGVGQTQPNTGYLNALAAVTVSDERSLARLKDWGVQNSFLVRPGIETQHISYSPLPLGTKFKLMVGSAPWTKSQFKSKGFEALLSAVQQDPTLHLVCLWRGVLFEEMRERVKRRGVEKQVEIINQKVDVNQVLAGVHASITLVTDPAIIRSYPYSLVESLAAGKPILVSRTIPMSAYVEQNGGGVVVEAVTPEAILVAIEQLRQRYASAVQAVSELDPEDFSIKRMIRSFQRVYKFVMTKTDSSSYSDFRVMNDKS